MIETLYAVNFLKGHLQRFINYNRINATIDCGDNYISFYAKDSDGNKQYLARGSNHHLRMQNMVDKDEPWKGENITIEFITPKSKQDSKVRATVQQNHYGGIKPFDVTIYQYNNIILDERDLTQIFRALITFLNGSGFIDPFKNTTKKAQVIPRTSNIKPYKEPPKKARNISVDKDGNYVSANAWGADYISESNNIYKYNCNIDMNKKLIRLTEADLHRIVKESVNKVLNEGKYVNNKPGFTKSEFGTPMFTKDALTKNKRIPTTSFKDMWTQYYKEKGEEVDDAHIQDMVDLCTDDNYGIPYRRDDFKDAYGKHQERQKNKDYVFRKKRERELLIKMLNFMGISLDKWKRMDKEKQDYVWEKYYEERPSSFRNGLVDSPRVQTNDNGEYLGYY